MLPPARAQEESKGSQIKEIAVGSRQIGGIKMCIPANKIYGNPTKLLTIACHFIKNKSLRITEVLDTPETSAGDCPQNN